VGLLRANYECEKNPNNLYLIIRKEYVDLRDSTMKDWDQHIGRKIVGNDVRYENGSVLMFRHGDDINALKNANLGGVLMVQAEEMTEEDFWFLQGRLRRKEGTRQLRLECNYDGKNWIYKLFNQQKIGRLITTNTFDNESNLPPDYIPNLQKLPKRLQERHLYGSDADMEGMVWDEYSEANHVIAPFEVPAEWSKGVVLDHGFTNPTAVIWAAVDFDGKVFIYDEHYEREKPVSYHADQIKERDNARVSDWLADPSIFSKNQSRDGQLFAISDEYADRGIFFRPADNNVLAGLNRVNEYFKSGNLFIFKNCVNLIEEIGGYKWKRLKPGQEKNAPEEPVKHKDHACDCLRYYIMSRPETPISQKKLSYEEHIEIVFDPFTEPVTEKLEVGIGGIE
jgi:phage terminase large subunit